jgi:hypothetical protein
MKQPLKGIVIVAIILAAVAAGAYWQLTHNKSAPQAGITNFEECVAAGNAIIKTLPARCEADGKTFTEAIATSTLPEVATSSVATSSANIRVTGPAPWELIGNPVTITGEAREFENVFNWRIRDGHGMVLAEGNAMTDAQDVGLFGKFSITTTYSESETIVGKIEVFAYSARDGSEIDMVSIPVNFHEVPGSK